MPRGKRDDIKKSVVTALAEMKLPMVRHSMVREMVERAREMVIMETTPHVVEAVKGLVAGYGGNECVTAKEKAEKEHGFKVISSLMGTLGVTPSQGTSVYIQQIYNDNRSPEVGKELGEIASFFAARWGKGSGEVIEGEVLKDGRDDGVLRGTVGNGGEDSGSRDGLAEGAADICTAGDGPGSSGTAGGSGECAVGCGDVSLSGAG